MSTYPAKQADTGCPGTAPGPQIDRWLDVELTPAKKIVRMSISQSHGLPVVEGVLLTFYPLAGCGLTSIGSTLYFSTKTGSYQRSHGKVVRVGISVYGDSLKN